MQAGVTNSSICICEIPGLSRRPRSLLAHGRRCVGFRFDIMGQHRHAQVTPKAAAASEIMMLCKGRSTATACWTVSVSITEALVLHAWH